MARLCRGVILITRLNQFAIFLEKKQLRIYNFFFQKSNVAIPRNEKEYINWNYLITFRVSKRVKETSISSYYYYFYFPCYLKEKINQIQTLDPLKNA